MDPIVLFRRDPTLNMARFYRIEILPTLFGEVSVLRNWGRIGTLGRMNIETCTTPEEAEWTAAETMRRKIRRGYHGAIPPGDEGPAIGILGPVPAR